MNDFEELHGKKEHNVCIFDGNYDTECQTVYLDHTKKKSHYKKRLNTPLKTFKKSKGRRNICPYEAPEVVQNGFLSTDFSD
jgi:hypothetical protein